MSFGHDTNIEALDEQIEEAVQSALTLISLYETMADSCNLKARLGENVQDDQDGG
jgi:hypothetical protein